MISLRFYRIYDIGREINLDQLERELARSYFTARASFLRVNPKSIMMEDPPLMLKMHEVSVERQGISYNMSVIARLYDIGAISLCFLYEDHEAPSSVLEDTVLLFSGHEGLSELFGIYLKNLGEILGPHIQNLSIEPDFFEDYSIYVTDRIDQSIDPAVLLSGERTQFSSQMREEIVRNTLSYTTEDIAILSYDSALLCNPENPTDLIDLIEFASVQVLELRYYDRMLNRQMEKMYDDIEQADRMWRIRRMRQYHVIMAQLMETYAEISEITEKVNNLIKVTEDVYYARVYATALKVMRSSQWSGSVDRKIEVIHENYSMLSEEVRIQHSNFLEWVVIILIAIECILGLLRAGH
ncbi:hypothetical protein [uncultured Methanospirillum sp.]|uniref:hypothetical protein n=1 Tax=uncultured Methanospirillum sp. TaxID=262503 RepID=UPI0029C62096|nr:hypothetical protein [uncultured Methanospirillum sp.]